MSTRSYQPLLNAYLELRARFGEDDAAAEAAGCDRIMGAVEELLANFDVVTDDDVEVKALFLETFLSDTAMIPSVALSTLADGVRRRRAQQVAA